MAGNRGTSRTDRDDPTAASGVARSASIGDPGPLGLAGFALTTFILSCVNSGILPATVEPVVFGLALFYGGIAQFAAGLWEFAKGNTFGATAFCSYGAFWMSFWYLANSTDLTAAGADANKGVGTWLLAWGIFTAYMTVAAMRTTGAIFAVFVVLTITFFLLAIGEYSMTEGITKIGGYAGILTALLAWYASFAGVTNATHQREALPTWPR
ncbi:MAG: acetate uptake transporter [Nocardioidaceae bacterium]